MIQLTNIDNYIDKRFQRTFILKGIDLTIEEGVFVTIMGLSGVGKSSLMRTLAAIQDAD